MPRGGRSFSNDGGCMRIEAVNWEEVGGPDSYYITFWSDDYSDDYYCVLELCYSNIDYYTGNFLSDISLDVVLR